MRPMDPGRASHLVFDDQMLAIADSYGNILYVSPELATFLGRPAEALCGSNAYDVVPDTAWEAVIESHEALLSGHDDLVARKVEWLGQCVTITAHLRPGDGRGHLIVNLLQSRSRPARRPDRTVRLRDPFTRP